jgi:hypothetical protein
LLSFVVLFLLLASSALAGPYGKLQASSEGSSDAEVTKAFKGLVGDDVEAQTAFDSGPKAIRAYVGLRATMEGASVAAPKNISTPGDERIASNWLAKAFDRLRWPKFEDRSDRSTPTVGSAWLTIFMWGVLALLGGVCVYLLARYVRLPGLRRRAKPIAPDEPLRTADAWLEEANSLLAQGRFREAVRGLYVAGLMRFDEAGVARFDPNQTNWEHLRRIEDSPKRPVSSDVRGATSLFDRCWYGHLPSSAADVATMRTWYEDLVRLLGEAVK